MKPADPQDVRAAVKAFEATKTKSKPAGNRAAAARKLNIPRQTLNSRLEIVASGRSQVLITKQSLLAELTAMVKADPGMTIKEYERQGAHAGAFHSHWKSWPDFRAEAMLLAGVNPLLARRDTFVSYLKRGSTLEELSDRFSVTPGQALDAINAAIVGGMSIFKRGELYTVDAVPAPKPYDEALHLFESDEAGIYRYGVATDNHIGNLHSRLDVLNDLYDLFERQGLTRVYNCGNWIDGEARFNRHELLPGAHGMDNQLEMFARDYPRRPGITTYFVAGDDHEGWYAQREVTDIGRLAEMTAQRLGRTDLRYLGYMEAYITLRHKLSGESSTMGVVHPGGGSAYAISYSPQKIVESYQGGEKPAVVNFGHYHKMDVFNYRNVWICQGGTTSDQTGFMRKKRIEAHVGGVLMELRQDEKGAITDCISWQKRYFDRGYHNYQWTPGGSEKILAPA